MAGQLAAEEQEEDRHAHGDAVRHLLGDHGARQVGHVGGDLDAAHHRPGVGDDGVRRDRRAARRAVRPQPAVYSRRLGTKDPLPRSAWRRSSETTSASPSAASKSVGHLDRPTLERRREQAARCGQGDVGSEGGVGEHLGAGHPAVADVADDQDAQALEAADAELLGRGALALGQHLAHGEAVEQRLGRVLVPAVAGVDHVGRARPSGPPGAARRPRSAG